MYSYENMIDINQCARATEKENSIPWFSFLSIN